MMHYIQNILMPDEKVIYSTRLSPILYVPVTGWCLTGIIILLFGGQWDFLNWPIENYSFYVLLGIGCLLLSLFMGINAYILLHTSEYALTDRRVIAKIGWLRQVSVDILLQKVESVTVRQTLFGRLFNYGTVIICGTGGSKDPFFRVKHPLQFRNCIQHQAEGTLHEGHAATLSE